MRNAPEFSNWWPGTGVRGRVEGECGNEIVSRFVAFAVGGTTVPEPGCSREVSGRRNTFREEEDEYIPGTLRHMRLKCRKSI